MNNIIIYNTNDDLNVSEIILLCCIEEGGVEMNNNIHIYVFVYICVTKHNLTIFIN